eukprot:scaffold191800_cov32-Tisochrysis_lutea.AAC.1
MDGFASALAETDELDFLAAHLDLAGVERGVAAILAQLEAVAQKFAGRLYTGEPRVAENDAAAAEPGLAQAQCRRRGVAVLVVPLLVLVPLLSLAYLEANHHARERVGRSLHLDPERLGLSRDPADLRALLRVAYTFSAPPGGHRLVDAEEPPGVERRLHLRVELIDEGSHERPRVGGE